MSPELINLIIQAGIFLATSGKGELFAAPRINAVLGVIVNAARSTPFIILVVAIIPFTRLIAGTSIGSGAAIVPLTIAATPFIARLVEAAIREVDAGLIETASSFGATPLQIVLKVLVPEALPGLLLALTLAVVSLLGYSAMVGAVGGGGLGDLGIRYGYQRFTDGTDRRRLFRETGQPPAAASLKISRERAIRRHRIARRLPM